MLPEFELQSLGQRESKSAVSRVCVQENMVHSESFSPIATSKFVVAYAAQG